MKTATAVVIKKWGHENGHPRQIFSFFIKKNLAEIADEKVCRQKELFFYYINLKIDQTKKKKKEKTNKFDF